MSGEDSDQVPTPSAPAPTSAPRRRWGSFPLAELTILAGIVALVVGIVGEQPTAIGVGVALAGLGGLEVSIREHFAGYRSHTTLLAGSAFVLTIGSRLLPRRPDPRRRAWRSARSPSRSPSTWLRRAFQRASGGLSFRVGGMRG